MRIAVCFSGMIRTGVYASTNIKKYIGNLYESIDFFMHTWSISEDKDWLACSRAVKNNNIHNKIIDDGYRLADEMCNAYDKKFVDIKIEDIGVWNQLYAGKYIDFSPQWYSWGESIRLKKHEETSKKFKYDIVLKMRPDVIYPPDASLGNEISRLLEMGDLFYAMNYTTIRVDDVFFLSNSTIMDKAADFFVNTEKRIWETNIFGEYLADQNITPTTTSNHLYTVLRSEALYKDINNFNICFNVDREYHAPYDAYRMPE